MIKIVTGKRPENHITSEDDRYRNAGIFGRYASILDVGERLSPSIISATTIRIASGDIMLSGVHGRIPYGSYEDVEIASGTTGYNRMDCILAVYKKFGGYENMTLEVVQGEPTTGTPSVDVNALAAKYGLPPKDPTTGEYVEEFESNELYMLGDALTSDTAAAIICYITLEGVNIKSITQRAKSHSFTDDKINLTNIRAKIASLQTSINTVNAAVNTLRNETAQSIGTVINRLSADEDSMVEMAKAIGTLNDTVKNLNSSISDMNTHLTHVEEETAANTLFCTDLSGQFQTLRNDVNNLQKSYEELNIRVTNLENK